MSDADQVQDITRSGEPQSRYADVLAEIDRLHAQKPGWSNAVLILGVSLLLFLGVGSALWSWKIALLLIPILLFHEAGHYAAMQMFGYRNLRMFFIPFFGAAVSGRNYNVPGWKKAVVSLMGPVPGIVLGIALGVAALVFEQRLLLEAAALMLFLNCFNLLPFLPLDVGWVAHAVFFSRHYWLDVTFRLLAVGALIVAGVLVPDLIFLAIGLVMLLGLPVAVRMGKIASRLRKRGVSAESADAQTIPADTAEVIIREIESSLPSGLTAKNVAQLTMQTFESLNARPPGWLASAAFAGVHVGSLVVGVTFTALFVVAQHTDIREFFRDLESMPPLRFACGEVEHWQGPELSDDSAALVLVASFDDHAAAEAAFRELPGQLPATSAMHVFGQSLFLEVALDEVKSQQDRLSQLQPPPLDVYVTKQDFPGVYFTAFCIAPSVRVAQAIEQNCLDYFSVAPPQRSAPPWSSHAEDDRDAASIGFVYRNGIQLQFKSIKFQRMAHGPQAFAAWLCERGCGQFNYRFDAVPTPSRGERVEE
jgi:Zn-dependent protease